MNLSIPMMVSPLGRLQCFSCVRSPLKSPSQCPSRNDRSFRVGELWADAVVENVADTPPIRRGSNRMFSRCFRIIVFWGLVTGSVKVHIGSSARVNKVQQAFSKGSARVQQGLTRISKDQQGSARFSKGSARGQQRFKEFNKGKQAEFSKRLSWRELPAELIRK